MAGPCPRDDHPRVASLRDTLGSLLAAPKYLGAQPGIIAALHTWSQTLGLHPHVHCLVTGGGLTPAGQWVAVRHGLLLPVRVVMAVLRGTRLAAIRQAFARGTLTLPEPLQPQQFLHLLNRLGHPIKTPWNVWIMERYRHGAGVVTYVARYLRGGPIKNARLVGWDGDCVTCTYRARQEEADAGPTASQRMTLPVTDFLQRWLRHVPVPQTRVVRCYGLYHHTHADALAVCRTALGQPPVEAPAVWIGRRCVPTGETSTRNGVRRAATASCAPASSRVAVRPPSWGLRSVQHAGGAAGRPLSGVWGVWRLPRGGS